jgi:hypothetical protein
MLLQLSLPMPVPAASSRPPLSIRATRWIFEKGGEGGGCTVAGFAGAREGPNSVGARGLDVAVVRPPGGALVDVAAEHAIALCARQRPSHVRSTASIPLRSAREARGAGCGETTNKSGREGRGTVAGAAGTKEGPFGVVGARCVEVAVVVERGGRALVDVHAKNRATPEKLYCAPPSVRSTAQVHQVSRQRSLQAIASSWPQSFPLNTGGGAP